MSAAIAAAILFGILLPYLVRPSAVSAPSGMAIWASVLALRAGVSVLAAAALVVYVPATDLFRLLTHWCIHGVLPYLTTHLGLSGHGLGDLATLAPAGLLVASVLSAAFGVWRGARGVRRWLAARRLGRSGGAVLVDEPEILVAAAGLRRPEIVISVRALEVLDEAELAAGLEHERGHIARRHRWILLIGSMLAALARPLPGTRHALAQLNLHLERDADAFAVRRTRDPLALASAICKAASTPAVAASLSGSEPATRVAQLISPERSRNHGMAGRIAAFAVVAITSAVLVATPVATAGGMASASVAERAPACR